MLISNYHPQIKPIRWTYFHKRFPKEVSIKKYPSALRNYAHSYRVEVLDSRDTAIKLNLAFRKETKNVETKNQFVTSDQFFSKTQTVRNDLDVDLSYNFVKKSKMILWTF